MRYEVTLKTILNTNADQTSNIAIYVLVDTCVSFSDKSTLINTFNF